MASRSNQNTAAEEPVAEQPVAEQPVAEQPAAEEPAVEQPGDEPVQPEEPTEEQSGAEASEEEGGIVASAEELARKLEDDIEELGIKIEAEGQAIVKLLTSLAGAQVKAPGEQHSCAPDEAVRLVRAGFAQPL